MRTTAEVLCGFTARLININNRSSHAYLTQLRQTLAKILQRKRLPKVGLLPTGSKEKEIWGVGSIPAAIFSSCQDMKTNAL